MHYEWFKILPCPCLNIFVPKLKCTAGPVWRATRFERVYVRVLRAARTKRVYACLCVWRPARAKRTCVDVCVLSLVEYLALICSMGRFFAKFKSRPLSCPCSGTNHDIGHYVVAENWVLFWTCVFNFVLKGFLIIFFKSPHHYQYRQIFYMYQSFSQLARLFKSK